MNALTKNTVSPVGVAQVATPAVVEVFDIEFRDIFDAPGDGVAKRATAHKMRVASTDLDYPVAFKPEDGRLIVKDRGATIQFTLVDTKYYPVAITFMIENGVADAGDEKRLGQLNFSQAKINPGDHSLSLTDVFMDNDTDTRYTFSIIIQRAADGKLGIIDCRAALPDGTALTSHRPLLTVHKIANDPNNPNGN